MYVYLSKFHLNAIFVSELENNYYLKKIFFGKMIVIGKMAVAEAVAEDVADAIADAVSDAVAEVVAEDVADAVSVAVAEVVSDSDTIFD